MKIKKIKNGEKFYKLTIIKEISPYINKHGYETPMYLCLCDCGKTKEVMHYNLKSGKTKSCGCIQKKSAYKNRKKYNKYDLSGKYGIGWTSNTNKEFYFDLEDYDKIKDYCWKERQPEGNSKYGYIVTTNKSISIHRMIMNCYKLKETLFIDHINGNVNDNRKENLRKCTNQQNSRNKKIGINNTSGFIGVYFNKKTKKYYAKITVDRKMIHLGTFNTLEEAYRVRRKAEFEMFGEFAPKEILKQKEENK